MVPLSWADQKLPKTIETLPSKVNIEQATAIYLKQKKYPRKSENLRKYCFFKQMAVARSIFTLGGWVQLFWTAFDMPMKGVPLEVALGWQKFYFWAFQKNNLASDYQV